MQSKIDMYQHGERRKNVLKFSHNWNNKVDCWYFTTIRKDSYYGYYSQRLNESFDVYIAGIFTCKAVLVECRLDDYANIPREILLCDTGYPDYDRIFKKFGVGDRCVILTLRRAK